MDHAAALLEQNRLLAVIARSADEAGPVPACPEWTLRQLFAHVGRGHRWAAEIVGSGDFVDPRTVQDGRPPDGAAAEWLERGAELLVEAVAADPDAEVWTFTGPRPAAWWLRRRLHEAVVHRSDAAEAVGEPYAVDAAVAADGVSEWLTLPPARPAEAGPAPLDDGVTLHLHATDDGLGSDGEWMVRCEGSRLVWEHGHGKGTVAVRGAAGDLQLAALRRVPADDARLQVIGDDAAWMTWLERTRF